MNPILSLITLFQTTFAPASNNLGVTLTAQQYDDNQVAFIKAFQALNLCDAIADFNPATTYSQNAGAASLSRYDGTIWKFIHATPQAGVTPGTDSTVWAISSPNELINKNQYLDQGGANQVSAADVKAVADTQIKTATVVVSNAELLAIFTTPKTLVAAVPGKSIVLINCVGRAAAGTTPYSDPGIILKIDTASDIILFDSNLLDGSTLRTWNMPINWSASGPATQYIDNKALLLTSSSVNPTAGDFGITLFITYRLI